ncbi:IS1380 family transposase, partial [bacterium]
SLPAYLGTEGWMVNQHLLPGSQHPQNGFIAFIRETLARVRQFCKQKLLIRADSAHDAIANLAELSRHRRVDFIIKWNPRKQDKHAWAAHAFAHGKITTPRVGKRVAVFSVKEKHSFTDADEIERTVTLRRVMRVTERSIDKKGQMLLEPDIELEGWWTSLTLADQEIIDLYKGHALCEQYHAEIKTDMDLERLPSGKFATNQLVMACGALVYNILRFIGQVALVKPSGIIRHEAKRRRVKTVIQELVYFAGRLITTGRRLKLRFSRHVTAHAEAFRQIYQRLAYG